MTDVSRSLSDAALAVQAESGQCRYLMLATHVSVQHSRAIVMCKILLARRQSVSKVKLTKDKTRPPAAHAAEFAACVDASACWDLPASVGKCSMDGQSDEQFGQSD